MPDREREPGQNHQAIETLRRELRELLIAARFGAVEGVVRTAVPEIVEGYLDGSVELSGVSIHGEFMWAASNGD